MTDRFSAGPSNDEAPVSEIETGSVGRRHKKRKGRAQANRIYTDGDVMACFGVSRNTLGNWCKAGLRSLKGEGPRLFLGRDLIVFDHARRNRPKQSHKWHEAHCVCCKGRHSLLKVSIEGSEHCLYHERILFICPETGGHASTLVSETNWDRLKQELESNSSSRSHD